MNGLNYLLELQQNYILIKQCENILKDNSNISILKKLKKDFEDIKAEYIKVEVQHKMIKQDYEHILREINLASEEIKELEDEIYNKSGSDFKLINSLLQKSQEKKNNMYEINKKEDVLLQKEDEISKNKETLKSKLKEIKYNFDHHKEKREENIKKAKLQKEEAIKNIQTLESKIPREVLEKFKVLMKEKGSAVGEIKNDICLGCSMKVSYITKDAIKKEKGIVFCDNCGRIVYCEF